MAKAAELDTDLINGLKVAKSKRAYFALVLKGGSDGALLVSKTKVPPAAIAEAKKQSGGSAVLKGFCQYEEGTYVFVTAKQAPTTAAQAVKVIAKRDAGLAVKAEFRVSADPELLAEEGDAATNVGKADVGKADAGKAGAPKTDAGKTGAPKPEAPKSTPPPAPPPPPPDGNAVVKRLNALTADIKTALAGPNKDRVKSLFVAVNGQLQSKDFAQASKTLDELAALAQKKSDGGAVLAAWQKARAAAVAKLNTIAAKIGKSKHAEASKALMMIKAVAANLPAEPNTPQKIAETVQYLKQDDVVLDVCQFAEDIRTPLLAILARLKA